MSYEDRRWGQFSGFTIHVSSSSSEAVQAVESYPDDVSLAGDIEWEHEQMLFMESEDWNVLKANIPGGFARRVYYHGDYGDSCRLKHQKAYCRSMCVVHASCCW